MEETRLEVRDLNGAVVESGEGELWLGGERRVCVVDDEVKGLVMRPTGDVARVDRGVINIIGRRDNQIKILGKRCQLDLLDAATQNLAGVRYAKYWLDPRHTAEAPVLCCSILCDPEITLTPRMFFSLLSRD